MAGSASSRDVSRPMHLKINAFRSERIAFTVQVGAERHKLFQVGFMTDGGGLRHFPLFRFEERRPQRGDNAPRCAVVPDGGCGPGAFPSREVFSSPDWLGRLF